MCNLHNHCTAVWGLYLKEIMIFFFFQVTADAYEKDLQEALLQSKLEFEKKEQVVCIELIHES